ncbi:Arylsulfatase like protein [Verticillium longisporum]|uniref:Arylsulfatase like protein n=1 Tax=Verticillium longisporum TaxID=100787 RepID=A0A8I3AVL3_VERLO|nr:Arylsulfatase like protein [Verticillium longisporum]
MLFSGTDSHIAGLGRPGYEGYLNFRVAALSEILQDNGYHTIMSGKWHLGLSKETSPAARGFDNSYAFLSGCGNHYNYEPQLDNPSHALLTPMNAGKFWLQDTEFLDRTKDIPEDFYSTTTFTDRLIGYLDEREDSAQPFFAYLPFTAPHWPLQAPRETIDKYKGLYDEGPAVLRRKRLDRLVELGLISKEVEPAPMTVELWDTMPPAERAESARKMEIYAAMVDLIDVNIGRVVDHLETTGELDNTFVLFMSDNGAEGAMLEALPLMGGAGPWKALYMTAPRGKDRWELYNLKNDPGEVHDLASTEPDILARLIEHWEVYYAETGMFDPGVEFKITKYF